MTYVHPTTTALRALVDAWAAQTNGPGFADWKAVLTSLGNAASRANMPTAAVSMLEDKLEEVLGAVETAEVTEVLQLRRVA